MTAATTQQWVCPACRHRNPIEADVCASCLVSFADLLRSDAQRSAANVTPTRRPAAPNGIALGVRELGIVVGLLVLWRLGSAVSLSDTAGAFARGRWIYHLEQSMHLPSEVGVQRGVLGHPVVVQALNVFYLSAHLGSLLIFLPWMYLRHRTHYARWRNAIAVFTLICLLVQLISVAPPRLLPQFGFVDTAARYHQSAYTHLGQGMVGQLSSMPSIHVGWALAIAVAVITASTSRWRWLVLAQPAVTCYAVVATANHFWLDGAAAAVILALVLGIQNMIGRRRVSDVMMT